MPCILYITVQAFICFNLMVSRLSSGCGAHRPAAGGLVALWKIPGCSRTFVKLVEGHRGASCQSEATICWISCCQSPDPRTKGTSRGKVNKEENQFFSKDTFTVRFSDPPTPTYTYTHAYTHKHIHCRQLIFLASSQPTWCCASQNTQAWFMCIVFKDTFAVARLSAHTSCVTADKGGAVSVIVPSQVFVKVVCVLIMNKRGK